MTKKQHVRVALACPTCGIELLHTMSYCNRCGANLVPLKDHGEVVPQLIPINSLIWAIVVTTIVVLGMGLGALVLMRDGRIDEGLGRIFVILCFLTLPIIEGLLVWQLFSSSRRVNRFSTKVQENFSQPDQLGATTARLLSEPREPVEPISSVTEHTTHIFEPSVRGREHT